jgi:hypothetical protein
MTTDSQQIVTKAWNFAHVLRDDGLSYMAYTEQITFLLFLKITDELTRPPHNRKPIVPPALGWQSLMKLDGFVKCYNPDNRHRRRQTWSDKNPAGRWRSFGYGEIIKRDKVNLDIFRLKDESLEDSDDLQTALEQFLSIAEGLTRSG